MSISSFLKKLFFEDYSSIEVATQEIEKIQIERFAINCGISLIANAVSAAEFTVYLNGEKHKDEEYFLWNVCPNNKQNKSEFITKLVTKLFTDGEVLIIDKNKHLYIADSFNKKGGDYKKERFTNVVIDNVSISGEFDSKDDIYISLQDKQFTTYMKSVTMSYANLLSYSAEKLKKSGSQKGVISVAATIGGKSDNDVQKANEALQKSIKKFLQDGDSVLPLRDGMKYEEIGAKTAKENASTEVAEMTKQIFSRVAEAMHIPLPLLLGNIADVNQDLWDNFITFAVKGNVTNQLETEINGKRYHLNNYLDNTQMLIDTSKIKARTPLDNSSAVFNLLGSGYSPDEISEMFGEQPRNKTWSKKHYITLNVKPAEELTGE